jgi:hypothetical protein
MELNRDFREFFESLARHDVRFLVVGGYAMAAHGHPRFTKDLDVWIWMDPDNGDAVIAALDDFGFGSLGLTRDDVLTADTVIKLGSPPERIDLITSPSGVEFEECWNERLIVDVGGVDIPFIGIHGLIANTSAAGREQDELDAKVLLRALRRSEPGG